MGKRQIWAIIILMSTALIGIIIIQLSWIKSSVDRNEKTFDSSVYLVLGKVQEKLEDKVGSPDEAYNFFKKNNKVDILPSIDKDYQRMLADLPPYQQQKTLFELKSLESSINPSIYLESIDPKELDISIREAMSEQNIDTRFEYGVYSNELEDFIIVNGIYLAVIGITENMSDAGAVSTETLYNSEYEIPLFASEFTIPGKLQIAFPNKTGWLWSSVLPSLLSSIIFTGLILFCFGYTIYVILRQKQVSKMKTDFINNMTHEFKTPIATISLAADSISNPKISSNPEKVVRFSRIIKEENKRMLSQVEKVLQMALLDKKDFSLNLTTVDIHSIIETAAMHGNLQLQSKNGSVETDFQAIESKIEGDETHISNIIHNLLDNAIKYTPDHPQIVISTSNRNNGIEITVADNGIGMTKDAKKLIFDKFYRVHTGNLHDVKGFGLGLSYVKAIVTAHKGRIDVESELGKGSKFIIFIPSKIM